MSFLGEPVNVTSYNISSDINKAIKHDNSYYIGYSKIILPPYTENNAFHSILAVDISNNIISNSNSFLVDPNFINVPNKNIIEYNNTHSIFTRLDITYKYLKNNKVDDTIYDEMFLLCNPFSSTNIGHDLSILLDRIHIYRQNKLTIPVVLSEFMLTIPRSLEICKLLLNDIPIYYLPNNKIIEFKNLHIPPNTIFDILKHTYLINEIIQKIIIHPEIKDKIDQYKNKKILLIKTDRNKNVVSKWSCFTGNMTLDMLCSKHDYIYINPENLSIIEIIVYLYYASKIVTSFGAISYAHTMFFNPFIKYYFLKTLHDPYFYKDRHIIINMSSTNLDNMYHNLPKLLHDE